MTGLVPIGIDEIGLVPGSHVCAFYRGDSDRDRLLSGYLGAGLSAGDKCICVVDSADTAQRLLVERHDLLSVLALRALAASAPDPRTRHPGGPDRTGSQWRILVYAA